MADTLRILGQIALTVATTEEQLYKVPANTSATISSIFVANIGSSDQTFIISIDKGDAGGGDDEELIYKDVTVLGNDTFIVTAGITLAATDSVNVNGSSTNLTFSIFGVEVT